MCEFGINVGGNLEILEVFFYEIFYIWRGVEFVVCVFIVMC